MAYHMHYCPSLIECIKNAIPDPNNPPGIPDLCSGGLQWSFC